MHQSDPFPKMPLTLLLALLIALCRAPTVNFRYSVQMGIVGDVEGLISCNTFPKDTIRFWRGEEQPNGTMICPFKPNDFLTCPFGGEQCLTANWTCLLPPRKVCDGHSECLEDECSCGENGTKVIYCRGGKGCLSLDRVCDTVPDCPDQEDEILCEGVNVTVCKNLWSVDVNIT